MHKLLTAGDVAGKLMLAFSRMLIHSLWQGLLFSVLAAALLLLAGNSGSARRYNMLLVLFFLFLLGCGFTFVLELTSDPSQNIHPVAFDKAAAFLHSDAGVLKRIGAAGTSRFTANAPILVLSWFVLFVFRSLRMMRGWAYLGRAKRKFSHEPELHWKKKVQQLCQQLRLGPAVGLMESGMIKTPLVIGHFKPLILIPAGLLSGLPPGQVEAVLLHELAHIRRNDYAVNLLQALTEAVFCFNPGLLWLSALLRDERENCCDDIALAHTRNKSEFIQALVSFQEHAMYGHHYSVAFRGKKSQLLRRVTRIIGHKKEPVSPGDHAFFLAGILGLLLCLATAALAQVGEPTATLPAPVNKPFRPPVAGIEPHRTKAATGYKKRRISSAGPSSHAALQSLPVVPDLLRRDPPTAADSLSDRQRAQQDRVKALNDRVQPVDDQTHAVLLQTAPISAKADPVGGRKQPVGRIDDE